MNSIGFREGVATVKRLRIQTIALCIRTGANILVYHPRLRQFFLLQPKFFYGEVHPHMNRSVRVQLRETQFIK